MSHVRPRLSLPIKLLLLFAASAYLWTVGLAFAPPNLRLPAPVVFLLCPACLLTITVDPSLPTVAFGLAPLNAIVYGLVGLGLGKVIRSSRS
jgi:hypothetical protein